MSKPSINIVKDPLLLVLECLERFDLFPARCTGTADVPSPLDHSCGVLLGKPQRGWFGRKRRPFIACFWFENSVRGATPAHWVVEVYGDSYVRIVQQLCESLVVPGSIEIELRVQPPRFEGFMSDG